MSQRKREEIREDAGEAGERSPRGTRERFPPPPMMMGCVSTPAWPPSAPTLLAQRVRARTHGPLKG